MKAIYSLPSYFYHFAHFDNLCSKIGTVCQTIEADLSQAEYAIVFNKGIQFFKYDKTKLNLSPLNTDYNLGFKYLKTIQFGVVVSVDIFKVENFNLISKK